MNNKVVAIFMAVLDSFSCLLGSARRVSYEISEEPNINFFSA